MGDFVMDIEQGDAYLLKIHIIMYQRISSS